MFVAEARIDIDAPLATVWRIMTDLPSYPAWNPFVVGVDGGAPPLAPGALFTLRIQWADGSSVSSPERVTRVEPPASDRALIAWRYAGWLHALNVIRAERVQTLCVLGDGKTRYESREEFHGFGARLLVPLGKVTDGFERHAEALRVRCEIPATPPAS